MKHLDEADLLLYYYRDGGKVQESEQHLKSCADCRGRFEELSTLLQMVVPPVAPKRSEEYGTEVWNRIRASLSEKGSSRRWWIVSPRWAPALAIAALVIVAFVLGRYSRPPQSPVTTAKISGSELRNKVLLVAVGDHLDRSQILLLELAHASGGGQIDISQQQRRAAELAATNRLYRQTAKEAGDTDIANTLDELERVLLEIGHQPDEVTAAELQQIQQRIQAQGIIFKIRVIRSKVNDESHPRTEPNTSKGQTT
jgi:hypothetical protein